MQLQYPPIPEHPEVDLIDQRYWKMKREEYMVLMDEAKQGVKESKNDIYLCLEFGAGEGASAAAILLANKKVCLNSVDIKSEEQSIKALQNLPQLLDIAWAHKFYHMSTEKFKEISECYYDLVLVDAGHTHEDASADINWAVEHSDIVVAHDICHPGTEHIDQICKDAAKKVGKKYLAVKIHHGLGIIY